MWVGVVQGKFWKLVDLPLKRLVVTLRFKFMVLIYYVMSLLLPLMSPLKRCFKLLSFFYTIIVTIGPSDGQSKDGQI